MAWITGNGSSVGPGIMRTGRVWHWAQLIVNTWLLCSGDREIGSHRGWPDIGASRLRTPDLDAVRAVGSAFWFSARARLVRPARAAPHHRSRRYSNCPCRGHFSMRSGGGVLGVAEDEVEVARVDEQAGALTQNEDGIAAPERVEQEGQSTADREIPEGARHHALAETLGRDPLDEEARGEEGLSEKSDGEPNLIRGHVTP